MTVSTYRASKVAIKILTSDREHERKYALLERLDLDSSDRLDPAVLAREAWALAEAGDHDTVEYLLSAHWGVGDLLLDRYTEEIASAIEVSLKALEPGEALWYHPGEMYAGRNADGRLVYGKLGEPEAVVDWHLRHATTLACIESGASHCLGRGPYRGA